MNSLKEWNTRPHMNKTFVNFKIFMRQQYLDLQAVGGLTMQTSSLNIVQQLKENQERLSESLKLEFQNGIRETINLMNQENISPNVQHGYIPSTYTPSQQAYFSPFMYSEEFSMQKSTYYQYVSY